MSTHLRRLTSLALLSSLCACASSDIEAEDAATWANAGSALAVYTYLHQPVEFAVRGSGFVDPACPVTSDDGTTVTITGGCTDSDGQQWTGQVTIARVDGPRDLDLTFDDYGHGDSSDIATLAGTAQIRSLDAMTYSYEVSLVHSGGATTEIDYAGTVEGDYDMPTLWNGSGTITRSGFAPTGTAEVSTVDQLVDDDICSGQSSSGQTTIMIDGHEIVITYDGETDCDDEHAARWSLDGKDRGLVEGITCAVTPAGGPLGTLLLLALLGLRRRERQV